MLTNYFWQRQALFNSQFTVLKSFELEPAVWVSQ